MIVFLEYIFLGILQGITEPIPVSSSGHVLIFQKIIENFTKNINIDFETLATITNFGSLVAIFIIFRKEIFSLIKSFFTYLFNKEKREEEQNNWNYCWKIVLATIPAGLFGIIATKIELLDKLEQNIKYVGLTLLITAIFLFIIRKFKGKKEKKNITFIDAFIIGLFQMVAVLPGISRSGATIVGSMFRDLKRDTAFDFSFILYIPISIATSLLGFKDILDLTITSTEWIYYIFAAVLAGIFTYICTKWFEGIVKHGKLAYFSIYCVIVGILVIIFL